MNLQYSGEPGSSLELEETAPTLEKLRHPKRIPVKCRQRNRFIPAFLIGVAVLSLVSNMDLIFSSLVETVSIAVLSLLYSLVLGVVFGMLAARNVFRVPVLSVATQALFTFLRAVPTPVWVLLMLVCLGMGPEAGVAGLCVHTTAFFTKSFAQSFESIPEETIEALEVTGASRLSIFCNAILPAAFSQIVAWAGMRLETNFSECAILGMVGAGGIGYVISNSLQGYDYGTAGVAILLVFLIAYAIERLFVSIKKKFHQ